jgi:hypothetical protein
MDDDEERRILQQHIHSSDLLDFVNRHLLPQFANTDSADLLHIFLGGGLLSSTPASVELLVTEGGLDGVLAAIATPDTSGSARIFHGCVAAFDEVGSSQPVSPATHRRVVALEFLLYLLCRHDNPSLYPYHKKITRTLSTAVSSSYRSPKKLELAFTLLGIVFARGKQDLPSKVDTKIMFAGYDAL